MNELLQQAGLDSEYRELLEKKRNDHNEENRDKNQEAILKGKENLRKIRE